MSDETVGGLPLLRLMQVFDSQFPVGGFAYSGGLETYAQMGLTVQGLEELLANQIALGWGRLDLAAAALAWEAAYDLLELEELANTVDAAKVIHSARQGSVQMGGRILRLAHRLFPDEAAGLSVRCAHQAVLVGARGCRLGVQRAPLLLAFGQSLLLGAVTAATRCMSLGPGWAQEALVMLQPALAEAVRRALENPWDSLYNSTPALDIRSHQQASLYTRLFQS